MLFIKILFRNKGQWLIIFTVLIAFIYNLLYAIKFTQGFITFLPQHWTVSVEIAQTQRQRALGLMFRKSLDINKGMLFIFEQEAIHSVWMKNTLIPLDILFISAQGKVISIIEALPPCKKQPCKIYYSTKKAQYMLEINANKVNKKNIKIGQQLLFK